MNDKRLINILANLKTIFVQKVVNSGLSNMLTCLIVNRIILSYNVLTLDTLLALFIIIIELPWNNYMLMMAIYLRLLLINSLTCILTRNFCMTVQFFNTASRSIEQFSLNIQIYLEMLTFLLIKLIQLLTGELSNK